MICPKCQGRLHTIDRQGMHIEQCERCRGIFLDHGELEQMLQAEQHYYGAAPYRGRPDSPREYRGHSDSPPPYGHGRSGHHPDSPGTYGHGGRRQRSFLGDLFG